MVPSDSAYAICDFLLVNIANLSQMFAFDTGVPLFNTLVGVNPMGGASFFVLGQRGGKQKGTGGNETNDNDTLECHVIKFDQS